MGEHQKSLDGIIQHCEQSGTRQPHSHTLEVNLDLVRLYSDLEKIYEKRVIIVRDTVNPNATFPTIMSMTMRYGITSLNVPDALKWYSINGPENLKMEITDQLKMRSFSKGAALDYFPSNFTPDLILKIIKHYMGTLPYSSKYYHLSNPFPYHH